MTAAEAREISNRVTQEKEEEKVRYYYDLVIEDFSKKITQRAFAGENYASIIISYDADYNIGSIDTNGWNSIEDKVQKHFQDLGFEFKVMIHPRSKYNYKTITIDWGKD